MCFSDDTSIMVNNRRQDRNRDPQARNWCLTVPVEGLPVPEMQAKMDSLRPSRAVWSIERGDEQGYLHYQTYIEFGRGVRFSTLQNTFGPRFHAEARKGTVKQCYDYCTKEETHVDGPWFIGDWSHFEGGQGHRSDIRRLHTALMETNDLDELWVDPDTGPSLLRYWSGAQRMLSARARLDGRANPRGAPQVTVLWGPTGTGKSARAWAKAPEAYPINQPATNNQPIWWDGYYGQRVVIFDDFRSQVRFSTLLTWLDRYTVRIDYRGGSTELRANRFIITSNVPPEEWYPNLSQAQKEPLMRRLTKIIHVTSIDQEIEGFPPLVFDDVEEAEEVESD